MAQKEKCDIYIIPPNFAQEGTIFSGRVKTRNAAEAAVLVFFLLQILLSLDISVRGKIYMGVIVLIPAAIFGVLGVQGESLTSFAAQFFRYLWNKRIVTVPDGRYRLKRNRRLKKQEQKQRKKGGRGYGKRGQRTETAVERSEANGKTDRERDEAAGKGRA